MVSLFNDRSPATIIWLFILSILVHSHFFVFTPTIDSSVADGLISVFINKYLVSLSPAFIIFTYHAIIILQSLRLNHLFTDNRMYSRVTYLPAMTYILLTGLFTEWSNLTPALIANTLVIWFFAKVSHFYNSPNPRTLLFDTGLLIGISTILYHPLAALLLAAFFALILLRTFVITEWLTLLMGLAAPFYFLICYLYLTGQFYSIKNYVPNWEFNVIHVHISILFFITIALIFFILLTGLYYWQQENKRLLIQIRNNWTVILVTLFIMLPLPFINKGAGIESLMLCIVSASPVIAKGFLAPKKNMLPSLMFWLLIILAIVKNWMIFKQ